LVLFDVGRELMPVACELKDGIIALRMIDVYVPADIQAALLEGLKDPRASGAVGLLFDVSRSISLNARSADEVAAMGYFLARQSDAFGRRVALVGFDDFPFGMMRMGKVTLEREGVTSEVFRTDRSAREWLLHGR
jgi:hypothetical protein